MKWVGAGIALVIAAFFIVNLVPFPHPSNGAPPTANVVSGISSLRTLSLFGFNTPQIPSWLFQTSTAILFLATAAFVRDGYDFWDNHR